MLDKPLQSSFLNKLRDPKYGGTLQVEATADLRIINHHLYRASIALTFLQGADFQKVLSCPRNGNATIKLSDNCFLPIKGTLIFKDADLYNIFVTGQFFYIIEAICSAADILGGLLNSAYNKIDRMHYPKNPKSYFMDALKLVMNSSRPSSLKAYLISSPSILDHSQFLPRLPLTDISLSDCSYSYEVLKKLRNIPEHNSYENLISVEASRDITESQGSAEYYAFIVNEADSKCGFITQFWPRLSQRKGGSRDVCVFGDWALTNTVDNINLILKNTLPDL